MTDEWKKIDPRPSPEELMAFADGELPSPRSAEVAGWVARNPEAAMEVEEYRRLRQLWDTTAPTEPPQAAWEPVLQRVEDAICPRRPLPAWRRLRPVWFSTALAASVLVAFAGWRLLRQAAPPANPINADLEPFPVAQADEIDILSMDAHDADSLVGQRPVLANLTFVAAEDLSEVRVDSRPGGRGARLEAGAVPIVVALPARQEKQP